MSEVILKIENLSKQYRLGLVGTESPLTPKGGTDKVNKLNRII